MQSEIDTFLLGLGLLLAFVAVLFLLDSYRRTERRTPYPVYGSVGLAVIAVAEALLLFDVPPVPVFFTPIVWTGYILAVDAAIYSLRERSLLRTRPEAFVWMAVLSIFLWLIFEVYNARLLNWTYVGLPSNVYLRYLGYGWSFATIIPAMLETAEFLLATRFRGGQAPQVAPNESLGGLDLTTAPAHAQERTASLVWPALGLVMLAGPVLLPVEWGVYLFGSVWLGFIFLVDPLNDRRGLPSIWRDLRQGYTQRLKALLASGALCGILWEFWNYWATAKWLYIFPILREWMLFEMPLPGFFGFPPFAVEMFALYILAADVLGRPLYEIRPSRS